MTAAVLVLHEIGDEAAGEPWRRAVEKAGFPAGSAAPDLPGHGTAPAPTGGSYDLSDPVVTAMGWLTRLPSGARPPVVIGVGSSGWSAQVLALGGRAAGLVLVDGLGGPWRGNDEAMAAEYEWVRAVADDPAATAAPPAAGLDPRAAYGPGPDTGPSRELAREVAAGLPGPTLVILTPACRLDEDGVAELTDLMTGAKVVRLESRDPDEVAGLVRVWADRTVTLS